MNSIALIEAVKEQAKVRTYGELPPEFYSRLHGIIGDAPRKVTWGASALYVELWSGIQINVPY